MHSTTVTFIDLPTLPLKHIFSYVGFKSLQRLRHVSKPLCHFIDTEKPAFQIDDLRIKVSSNSVNIMLKSSGQNSCLEVKEHHNGTLVSSGTSRPRIQKKKMFLDISMDALQHDLKNQKLPIGKLKLELDNTYSEGKNSEFLEKFQELLGADPLRVQEFHLEGHEYQMIQLLPLFEAGTLKTINFSRDGFSFEEILNNDLMQMEQWKKAKTLISNDIIYDAPIQNFSHFDSARALMNTITTEDLEYLKEIYTQSPSFKQATIHFMDSDPFDGSKQYFRCSDPNFALFFSSRRGMFIQFVRVPISDVPDGAFEKV